MKQDSSVQTANIDELKLGGIRGFCRILWRIVPYVLPYWDKVLLRVIIAQCTAVLTVIGAITIQRAVDEGLRRGNASAFCLWSAASICIAVVTIVFWWSYVTMASYVMMRLDLTLKRRVFSHVQRMALHFHHIRPIGENMYRISNDAAASAPFVGNTLSELGERVLALITVLSLVLALNPLILLLLAVYILAYLLYSQVVVGLVSRYWGLVRANQQDLLALLQEILTIFPMSKALSRQRHDITRYFHRMAVLARSVISYFVAENLWGQGGLFLQYIWTQIAYFGICAYLVVRGGMSVGEFIALQALIPSVLWPLQNLIWSLQNIRISAVPILRLFQTLDMEPEIREAPRAHHLHVPHGAVEFERVHFRYESRSPYAVRDLSFRLEPGKKLAILGVSGAGKTTIFNLLMRLADPSSGRVLIDGRDLREIALESYLRHTAVVLQDNFLFSATIRDNILFGNERATPEQLNDAIDRAGLWPTIHALPDGLNTVLLEGGNLSMGQKQRIAIARAVIRNPKFLFLDEATAALDPITEDEVLAQLAEIEGGRTRIVISHHVSSVRDADEILVMENGACVQRGKHDELMRVDGPYRSLWAAEAEKHAEYANGAV
jgi:ABC-type multidrug transport system fused ATPase/permease subunit